MKKEDFTPLEEKSKEDVRKLFAKINLILASLIFIVLLATLILKLRH